MADDIDEDLFGTYIPDNKIKLVIGGVVFTNASKEVLDDIFDTIENHTYATTCVKDENKSVELDIIFNENTTEKRRFNTCVNHQNCIFFGNRCTKIIPDSDTFEPRKYRIPNEPQIMTKSCFQRLASRFCK